ncbi:MAG: hypothetical protein LC789_00695, partial [Actinobacteria bacterium]|nr:hypothetical protein [Actinomycetota bacterium]MCA1722568.1 hypothetical protein [Actinomycetota bacterium]
MTSTAGTSPRPLMRRGLMVLAALAGTLLIWVPSANSTPLELGYRDQSYGTTVTAPTGQKPQSKLWYTAGTWWGVLWSTGEKKFTIHAFNLATEATNAWTSTGVAVDVRRNSSSDVLWDEAQRKLYVVTHLKETDTTTADRGIKFLRYGFANGSYAPELSKTVVTGNVEAAVLDKDSTGRLWITYTEPNADGSKTVKVAHSTGSDAGWTAPFPLPVGTAADTSADDISTVVAYGDAGGRKIGVLWSNERTSALYFASHPDGAGDDAWTLTTLCSSTLCPDDHLNIKSIDSDASGNLYAVVKTSLNDASAPDPNDPLIVAYRLNPSGSWTSTVAWTVGDNVTRAIVVLDSDNREAHLFAAGPCCAGGTVYTKTSGFDDLRFPTGLGTPFMRSERLAQGEAINNVTSTKQTVNRGTGLLVLAGIDKTREYVHRYLPLDGGASATPSSPSPAAPSPSPSPSPTAGTVSAPQNLGELGRASSSTTGNTLTLTTTSAVPAGARVVVAAGYSGAAGITATAADDAGSAWSLLVRKENGTSVGTTTALFTATAGAAGLPVGTKITMTVSTNVTYKIAVAHAFSGVGSVAGTSDGTGSTSSPAAAPVTAAAGDVLFSVAMWNSG